MSSLGALLCRMLGSFSNELVFRNSVRSIVALLLKIAMLSSVFVGLLGELSLFNEYNSRLWVNASVEKAGSNWTVNHRKRRTHASSWNLICSYGAKRFIYTSINYAPSSYQAHRHGRLSKDENKKTFNPCGLSGLTGDASTTVNKTAMTRAKQTRDIYSRTQLS